jgi:hypothetical protein
MWLSGAGRVDQRESRISVGWRYEETLLRHGTGAELRSISDQATIEHVTWLDEHHFASADGSHNSRCVADICADIHIDLLRVLAKDRASSDA